MGVGVGMGMGPGPLSLCRGRNDWERRDDGRRSTILGGGALELFLEEGANGLPWEGRKPEEVPLRPTWHEKDTLSLSPFSS